MTFNHAVIWIDHHEAHVIHFNAIDSTVEKIKSSSKQSHLHHHRGTLGSGKAATPQSFLHEVVESFSDAKEVLVVGPGSAKLELIKHVHQHDPKVSGKIMGVETVDHPTDPQLLAFAKKCFLKIDNLKGDDF